MPNYRVEYVKPNGLDKGHKDLKALSSEALTARLESGNPGLKILSITEITGTAAAPAPPPKPDFAESVPSGTPMKGRIMPPPAVGPKPDSGQGRCLWAAKVERRPYSDNALIRLLISIVTLVNFLVGNRTNGQILEFEEQISVRTKTWSLWIFETCETTTWIKKSSISGTGKIKKRGFFASHQFVHLDYADGSSSGQLFWIKGCNAEEIDQAVERWIGRS